MQTALSRRGVSVIALPGDVALRDAVEQGPRLHFPEPKPRVCPSDDEIAALAKILNASKKITILGGAGCAGAHAELIELASKLNAPIVHAMRGQGVHRVRQPVRRGHDRPARILVRLSRDDELRRAADARNGLSVPAVLSQRTRRSSRSTSAANSSAGARRSTTASWETRRPLSGPSCRKLDQKRGRRALEGLARTLSEGAQGSR